MHGETDAAARRVAEVVVGYNSTALWLGFTVLTARRFLIRGRVQGVGFRFFAEDVAGREGVRGYVRNLPDGRVEAVVEGEAEAIDRFERAMHHGPRGARVEGVETEPLPAGQRFTNFAIR